MEHECFWSGLSAGLDALAAPSAPCGAESGCEAIFKRVTLCQKSQIQVRKVFR